MGLGFGGKPAADLHGGCRPAKDGEIRRDFIYLALHLGAAGLEDAIGDAHPLAAAVGVKAKVARVGNRLRQGNANDKGSGLALRFLVLLCVERTQGLEALGNSG